MFLWLSALPSRSDLPITKVLLQMRLILIQKLIFVVLALIAPSFNMAQSNKLRQFSKLSLPEKRWVVFHPFIAAKAWKITEVAQNEAQSLIADTVLDGDANGGKVDAFRHAYWMALLCRDINWRKARRLGIAHEKGNKRAFKKGMKEDGGLPDQAACEMDIYNNESGIKLWKQHREAGAEEMRELLIQAVLSGKMKVIRKNANGLSLDSVGEVIPNEEWKGRWENRRCLAPSNAPSNR